MFFLPTIVNGEQENRVQKGNGYFQVPPHTPVIFGEAGGRTLFRYNISGKELCGGGRQRLPSCLLKAFKGAFWLR